MKYAHLMHRLPLAADEVTCPEFLYYLETIQEVVVFIFSIFDTMETVILGFIEAAIGLRDTFCSNE